MLLQTFRTLNDFKRKANKWKFAYVLSNMIPVTTINPSNLVLNLVCRSHEKFLLWTNSLEIKHTFFVHPTLLVHWNLHPWWRVDIQLSNTFEYDSRCKFFTVHFHGSNKRVCVVCLSLQVWTFSFCFCVYH